MITEGTKNNMKKTLCFLFSGKAGVGKSFSSELLEGIANNLGYNTGIFHLATHVKIAASGLGWDGQKDKNGRTLLQSLGRVGRRYDKSTWVRKTFNDILNNHMYPFDIIIIDDWRFPDEYDYIDENEKLYKIVKIRIEANSREILKDEKQRNEESEVLLDKYNFDYTIYNETLSEQQLKDTLTSILDKQVADNLI